MDLSALHELITRDPLADVAACRRELEHIRRVRGLLDAREVKVLSRLDAITAEQPSVFPEGEVADAAKAGLGRGTKVRDRKKVCDLVPELGEALAAGSTTGDRVDAVAKATSGLSEGERAAVAEQGAVIAAAAASATDRQFREVVERIVGESRQHDGREQLSRQRSASRLRWWNGADGMWNLAGSLDPVRGAEAEGRLRKMIEALFHGGRGGVGSGGVGSADPSGLAEEAPTDPIERQQYLAAMALVELLSGAGGVGSVAGDGGLGGQSTGPDVTVLIDFRTLFEGQRHSGSVVDAGLGRFGLPIETVRRWACLGTVTPVVVAADGVRLFLGRETRLANRHQRRALRVLYRTCALCDVPFEHTQIHHVSWFSQHEGGTDLPNLLPLCTRHHHLVHEGGWHLRLRDGRTLVVTMPDGSVTSHSPPTQRAA